MRVSVLIPTWRRPAELVRGLSSLARQDHAPEEVVVVGREGDAETWSALEAFAAGEGSQVSLRAVRVSATGVVASLNAGLAAAGGELVVVTDDDTVLRPDWLARIVKAFGSDPRVGGVGGRDWVHQGERLLDGRCARVGEVRWFGRVVGNHHLGVGGAREVDLLKGANMAFRREALGGVSIDERLRGRGTQVHWEVDLCLAVKRAGWKLVYDPAIALDHFTAPRRAEDTREPGSLSRLGDEVYNETYGMLKWLPWPRKLAVLAYGLAVGTRRAPGLATALEQRLRGRPTLAALAASTRARLEALGCFLERLRSAGLKESRVGPVR